MCTEPLHKPLRLLLVVGTANDIFIYHMARWLKASMEVETDVFECWPAHQQAFDSAYYHEVASTSLYSWFYRRPLASFTKDWGAHRQLVRFLRGRHYDVIHCHWLSAPVVLSRCLSRHCDRLFATFWGGELEQQRLWRSHACYMWRLRRFMRKVDVVVNSEEFHEKIRVALPEFQGTYRKGNLGSAPLEELYRLMGRNDRAEARRQWQIADDAVSVLIGYSGKELHQHLEVIAAFSRYPEGKGTFHLLAPMTRSADPAYTAQVEQALASSGYRYTLIRDCFLSDAEQASLRYATDVAFQASRFDGFSRSIVECLCAGSLLLYGQWLPYEAYLKDYGFFALPMASAEDGVRQLVRFSSHRESYAAQLAANTSCGRSRFLWSECIRDWVDAYQTC